MKLIYNVQDKPKFGQMVVFGFQQLLAILAATIAVPSIVGNGMSQSAALFGAGVGTIVYLLFTKFRSPVFLGSSFASSAQCSQHSAELFQLRQAMPESFLAQFSPALFMLLLQSQSRLQV